jgi:hypothetical protein
LTILVIYDELSSNRAADELRVEDELSSFGRTMDCSLIGRENVFFLQSAVLTD